MDSGAELDGLFASGVTELRSDHPDKDNWTGSRSSGVESLDRLTELGYQLDEDGTLRDPVPEDELYA